MKHSYKPLPDYLILKPSSIHGIGVFAEDYLPKEFSFGISHYKILQEGLGFNKDIVVRTPLGGFINHSENPNMRLVGLGNEKTCMIFNPIALRDIKEGEELTLNYLHSEICCDQDTLCDRSKIEFI